MTRISHAWRALEREQHLAALASLGLFVSMFLPWYSKTDTVVVKEAARATQQSLSAFQAFSFVEAAVLLVSAGVLALLFARGEQREFQLPGGDGIVVMLAGGWVALLVFYRLIDKPGLQGNQRITATVGVEWGIFLALLLALGLLYAGQRMRAEERPGPPLMRRGRAGRERPRPAPSGEQSAWEEPAGETLITRPSAARAGAEGTAEGSASRSRASARPVPARGQAGAGGEPAPDPAVEEESRSAPGSVPAREGEGAGRDAETAGAQGARRASAGRPRFPPPPSDQMSFEDQPPPAGESDRGR